ncbi:MAG: Ig-like domain-containing protein [Bacteroidota bacterium]
MRPAHVLGLLVFALTFSPTVHAMDQWEPSPADPLDIFDLPTLEEALAPGLGLTLGVAIVGDDGDGEVGPGERVQYSGTLSNPGDATATGISFQVELDPNLELDRSTILFAPVALPDAYATDTDTPLIINAGVGPEFFLSANDFDLDKPLPKKNVVPVTGQATTEGGTVDITNRGGFVYTPPNGFTGDDTFTYTLTDRTGQTAVGTATVSVGNQLPGVWFVDANAAPGGNGSMSAPFQDHTPLNGAGGTGDVDEPGQTIFFYEGTYDIDDSFHLEPGQTIVGQGVDLVIGGEVIVSGTPAQRPAITHDTDRKLILADNLELVGFDVGTPTTPVGGTGLDGSAGGITSLVIDEMTIHTNGGPALHLVDGALDLDLIDVNATHNAGPGMIIGGTATGTTSISGAATLTGTTGADLSGTHTVNFTTVDIDATAGAGIDGFGGTTVTIGSGSTSGKDALTNGSIDAIGGPALDFSNGATLSGTLTSLSSTNSTGKGLHFNTGAHNLTVTGATAVTGATGTGIHLDAVAAASSFTFGATSVNGATDGIWLQNNTSAAISFGDTDVSNVSAEGIQIDASNGTHTFAAGSSITSATGTGLSVSNGTPTVGFSGSITNTAGRSLAVSGLSGGSVTVGGTIDDDGTGIATSGNTGATINLNGNLDLDTATNTGLSLGGGGTVNVNGASNAITTTTASAISCSGTTLSGTFHDVDVSAGTARGIDLDFCVGGKTFVDVDLITTNAHGFHARSAGSIQVTGMTGPQAQSTVNTTNGRAVNIQSSTIGVSGIMFGSVASNGGDHGIVLSGLAGSGAFHVTGIGPSDPTVVVGTRGREGTGNGSGGTIQNSTSDHVSLTGVNNVVLRHMVMNTAGDDAVQAVTVSGLVLDNTRLDGTQTHGVRGVSLSNLTVLNSEVINAGNNINEDAFNLIELLGSSSITNTVIDEHQSQGVSIRNDTKTSAATPDVMMIRNTEITDSDPIQGEIGIEFTTSNTAAAVSNFSLHVLDSFIARIEGNAVQATPQGTNAADPAKAHVEVRRTTITGTPTTSSNATVPSAVQVNTLNEGAATFVIADNNAGAGGGFSGHPSSAIIIKNDSNGSLEGFITNTTASAQGEGLLVFADGNSGSATVNGRTVVSATGNTFTNVNNSGGLGADFLVQDSNTGRLDVTLANNVINGTDPFGFAIGARFDVQDTIGCFNVATAAGAGNNTFNGPGFTGLNLFVGSSGTMQLQGFGGGSTAAAGTFVDANNSVNPSTVAFASSGGTIVPAPAPCATPSGPAPLTFRLPDLATESPEMAALETPEPAPMPTAETRAPFVAEAAPERRRSAEVSALRRAVASGPEADEDAPEPVVEILELENHLGAGTLVVFAINDLPAGVSAGYSFEATTGQTIKTSTLSTTITASAVNATSVDETVTIESHPSRFIEDNIGAGWRTLGIPAEDFTVNDLAQFNLVQCLPGYYENQARCDNLPAANLFTGYDGTALVPASGPTEELARGTGIYWYLFDETFDPNAPNPPPSPSQSFELPMTLTATGPTPAGDVTVSLHADGDRWNLLANPFPQDLDVSGIGGWTIGGTLQTPIGQIWNPNKETFTLTSQRDDKLAAWQGAFFRNFDASSLQFMESAVVDDAQFTGKAPVAERPQRGLSFELTSETAEGAPTTDEAITLAFGAEAHPGLDALDVEKLAPPIPAFALGAFEDESGILLAQRSLPHEMDRAIAVPLHVIAAGTEGTHVLSWPRVEDMPETWTLRLEDRVTGATVDLREASAYSFETDSGDQHAAQGPPTRTGETTAAKGENIAPLWRPTIRLPDTAASLSGSATGARFLLIVGPGEPEITDTPATGTEAIVLDGAFPNPFGASTSLRYTLPNAAPVRLAVYDVLGREVAVLVDREQSAGTHTAAWAPRALASGTYLVRLRVELPEGASVERSMRVTHNR